MNEEEFWLLPGPRHHLRRLRGMLLDGESLVLRQPSHAPDLPGWLIADPPAGREVLLLEDAGGPEPEEAVRAILGLDAGSPLAGCCPAHGEPVVMIRGVARPRVGPWLRLLRRHLHSCLGRPGSPRLLLCLDGPAGAEAAQGQVPMLDWQGVVGRLDMHMLCASLWAGRDMSQLARDLCVTMTREVAAWCPTLARRLAEGGPEAAFDPSAVLAELREERGWAAAPQDWLSGSTDGHGGMALVHAAAATPTEIARRIWRAQVEVVFPLLEVMRGELARHYARQLVPDAPRTAVQQAEELDIGPLVHRLRRANGIRQAHRELAEVILAARNRLAHCEGLGPDLACHALLLRAGGAGGRLQ